MSPKIGFKHVDPRSLHGLLIFVVAKARSIYKPRWRSK